MARYVRKRLLVTAPSHPFKRLEDGREVCLANEAGRAEYLRRKQLCWQEQRGLCSHCSGRMSLLDTRLTGGDWSETGQQRDDRLIDKQGRRVNELVHKGCLRAWHEQHARQHLSSLTA